jgi:hypothetical protein
MFQKTSLLTDVYEYEILITINQRTVFPTVQMEQDSVQCYFNEYLKKEETVL